MFETGEYMIYFDNAATTGKKPISVIDAVNNALYKFSANPGRSGHKCSQDAAYLIYNTRNNIANYFDANGAECVAFTANCTHSINFVLKGCLKSDDHIIVSDMEHNAVMRPLIKCGADYSVAEVSFDDDNLTVNNFKKLIKKNTKMIFCTAASNVTGKILPLEKIGQLCKENDLLFGVDGAQLAGVLPIKMKEMNIDYLCIAPHKGLYAPMGLGILISNKSIKETIIEGGTGTNSVDYIQPVELPERLESGTVNLPAISGTNAGLEFVKKYEKSIYNHEMQLATYFYNWLDKLDNVNLYTPYPKKISFAPVISFNIKGYTSEQVSEMFNKYGFALRGGLHCAPSAHNKIGTTDIGTVRFSPSFFNNINEVKKIVNIIKKL